MLTQTDFENGNIDVFLINKLEKKGCIGILKTLEKYNKQYPSLEEYVLKYLKIYFIDQIFNKKEIHTEFLNLVINYQDILKEFIKNNINDISDFLEETLFNLFNLPNDSNERLKIYEFFYESLGLKYCFNSVEKSILGILFQEDLDVFMIHIFLKKIFVQKKYRTKTINLILDYIQKCRRELNTMEIIGMVKYTDQDKFNDFSKIINKMNNALFVLLIFWEKGINDNRLKQINVNYCLNENFNDWKISNDLIKEDNDFSFLTQCFFCIHLLQDFTLKTINELLKNLSKSIHDIINYLPLLDQEKLKIDISKRRDIFEGWKREIKKSFFKDDKMDLFFNKSIEWCISKNLIIEEISDNIIDYYLLHKKEKFLNRELFYPFFNKINNNAKNPYLKIKFLELIMFDITDYNKVQLYQQDLTNNLINLFVNLENIGSSNQFYEKFAPRVNIIYIFNYLLKRNSDSKNYYLAEIKKEYQVRFIFLLLNDAQYLLEEVMINIKKINKHEKSNNKEDKLNPNEIIHISSSIKSYNIYIKEFLIFIEVTSSNLLELFNKDEITDKIAILLDTLLLELVGKERKDLIIKDSTKYYFNPLELLGILGNIYINLGYDKKMIEAISNERLYKEEYLEKLIKIIMDKNLFERQTWFKIGLLSSVKQRIKEYQNTKIDYDEYNPPLELCDPLMMTLIENPIKLPISDIFMDKSVIIKHLLSDETDPFNRSKLTPEMIEEYNKKEDILLEINELKNKIEDWKKNIIQ
jgi:hypothetical protein